MISLYDTTLWAKYAKINRGKKLKRTFMMMLSPHKQISNDTWIGHIIRFLYKFLQHKTKKKLFAYAFYVIFVIKNQKKNKFHISSIYHINAHMLVPHTLSPNTASERASKREKESFILQRISWNIFISHPKKGKPKNVKC